MAKKRTTIADFVLNFGLEEKKERREKGERLGRLWRD